MNAATRRGLAYAALIVVPMAGALGVCVAGVLAMIARGFYVGAGLIAALSVFGAVTSCAVAVRAYRVGVNE